MATEMHSSYKTFVALAAAALIAFGCGEVKTPTMPRLPRIHPNLAPQLTRLDSRPSSLKCPPKR